MSAARKELQEALYRYISDTVTYILIVTTFCEDVTDSLSWMEKELAKMIDIKERVDSISLNIDHISKSNNKGQAIKEYVKSKVKEVTADSRRAKLLKELDGVLKDTLEGLKKLDYFLDAVEKLAVTSLHVFIKNHVLHLPKEIELEDVQVVILAARNVCPLLLQFKRDANAFFIAKLQNVDVLIYQLDKYIQTTQRICDAFKGSSFSESSLNLNLEALVDLDVDLPKDNVPWMLHHINQLREIRKNQAFQMVFLFEDEQCSDFIKKFSECQPRMRQFLKDLEENAVQLNKMNKGAKISSVAGSSVGAVGGILSIVGLALMPVTAGASLILTMTGVGLGMTSGVNSLVTTATEFGVNYTQSKQVNQAFEGLLKDVETVQNCLDNEKYTDAKKLQDCVDDVKKTETPGPLKKIVEISKMAKTGGTIIKGSDSIVDAASAFNMLGEDLIISASKAVAQDGKAIRNIPRVASDVPDIGQAVAKGPLALSKSARAGFIVANSLFLGMDIFFICKDSISLSKGEEAEMSCFIRARSELWNSEIESWQKIHDLLSEALSESEKNKLILETPFYPEM